VKLIVMKSVAPCAAFGGRRPIFAVVGPVPVFWPESGFVFPLDRFPGTDRRPAQLGRPGGGPSAARPSQGSWLSTLMTPLYPIGRRKRQDQAQEPSTFAAALMARVVFFFFFFFISSAGDFAGFFGDEGNILGPQALVRPARIGEAHVGRTRRARNAASARRTARR